MQAAQTLSMPTIAKRRKTWAQRTGQGTRAAKIVAKAMNEKPEFYENAEGFTVRRWKKEDLQRFTNEDVAAWLRHNRAVDSDEAEYWVPPTAVKYAITKGWVRPSASSPKILLVTRKGALDLKLPPVKIGGATVKFAD